MTDRRVGSFGLTVEVVPTPSRQVGSTGLTVEGVPSSRSRWVGVFALTVEALVGRAVPVSAVFSGNRNLVPVTAAFPIPNRQTGSISANVDLTRTYVTVNRQTGSVGANVDLNRTGIVVNRQTGSVDATVDLARTNITTNRQTGSVGANVDLSVGPSTSNTTTQRRIGAVPVNVDFAAIPERRFGASGAQVDFSSTPQRRFAGVALNVEYSVGRPVPGTAALSGTRRLVPVTGVFGPARQIGAIGVDVDLNRVVAVLARQLAGLGVTVDLNSVVTSINRQLGSVGVTVDLGRAAIQNRQAGAVWLQVDIFITQRSFAATAWFRQTRQRLVPSVANFSVAGERRTGGLSVQADVQLSGAARQVGSLFASADIVISQADRQTGWLAVMADVFVQPNRAVPATVQFPPARLVPASAQLAFATILRVAQAALEVPTASAPNVVTAQASLEVLTQSSANVQTAQAAIEVLTRLAIERTVPATVKFAGERVVPVTAQFRGTRTRAVPVTAAFKGTRTRSVPATGRLGWHQERVVPATAIIGLARPPDREVPVTVWQSVTYRRYVPADVALPQWRQVPIKIAIQGSRPVPIHAALAFVRQVPASTYFGRGIPILIPNVQASLGKTERQVPASAAFIVRHNLVPVHAIFYTLQSSIPTRASLRVEGYEIPVTASLGSNTNIIKPVQASIGEPEPSETLTEGYYWYPTQPIGGVPGSWGGGTGYTGVGFGSGGTVFPGAPPRLTCNVTVVRDVFTYDFFWTSWGNNTYNQLGFDQTNTQVYQPVHLEARRRYHRVYAGQDFAIGMSQGRLYEWGTNNWGQRSDNILYDGFLEPRTIFTYDDPPPPLGIPTPYIAMPMIQQAACGNGHVIALDVNGHVWTWGRTDLNQTGWGLVLYDTCQFIGGDPIYSQPYAKMTSLPACRFVTAGEHFSMAVDQSNNLWVAGRFPGSSEVTGWTNLGGLGERIMRVRGGRAHAALVTESGKLYTFGANNLGQLGTGGLGPSSSPVHITDGVLDAAPLYDSTLVLYADGSVAVCGDNSAGQCGQNVIGGNFTRLQRVLFGTMVCEAIGYGALSKTAMVVLQQSTDPSLGDTQSEVWGWGDNSNYQLLTGATGNSALPQQLGVQRGVTQIALGPDAAYASDDDFKDLPMTTEHWRTWGTWDTGATGAGRVFWPYETGGPTFTVRYLIDFTCSFTTGCDNTIRYPLAGRRPILMHTHLDAPAPDTHTGGTEGFLCSLKTFDGDSPGSIFIQANVGVGQTDATGISPLVIDDNATEIVIDCFSAAASAGVPVHFTGYTDVTYSDGDLLSHTSPGPMMLAHSEKFAGFYVVRGRIDGAFAMDRLGRVHNWGLDEQGQLGSGAESFLYSPRWNIGAWTPLPVPNIETGWMGWAWDQQNFVRIFQGDIMAWGKNDQYQLGLGHNQGDVWVGNTRITLPISVPSLFRADVQKMVGNESLSLAILYDGRMLVAGTDTYGIVGPVGQVYTEFTLVT